MPHSIDLSGGKLRRFAVHLVCGNVAIIALLLLSGWLALKASLRADEARAVETVTNLAATLAGEIAAELRLVDNALSTITTSQPVRSRGASDTRAIEEILRYQKQLLPEVDAIRLAGSDGLVHLGIPRGSATIDIADRSYFQEIRQSGIATGSFGSLYKGRARVPSNWRKVTAEAHTS